jgi:uncharacterized protein YndB with AHSA1/START domain
MATGSPAGRERPLRLQIRRSFEASRDRVFRAFTGKEGVRVWFASPSHLSWLDEPFLDLRPGGSYRFRVGDGKNVWTIHGSYLEVKPPERVKFTWLWENDPIHGDSGESVVTVDFEAHGASTIVLLTHEGLPSERSRQEHDQGWAECLESLVPLLTRGREVEK